MNTSAPRKTNGANTTPSVSSSRLKPLPDQRELTLLSAWFFGRPCLPSPKFWLTGIAFLALYLALNKLTEWHQFDGLGITLWSPDTGWP